MHVHQSPPLTGIRVRVNLLKTFCARNCIKFPELYRKVMLASFHPWDGDEGGIYLKGLLGFDEMSKSAQKSHFFQPLMRV